MSKTLTIIFITLSIAASSQQLAMVPVAPPIDTAMLRYKPANGLGRLSLHTAIILPGIAAGIAQGRNDVLQNNIWGYRERHPNANERWFNPDSTWRRANGSNWFAANFTPFAKDQWHLNQAIATFCITTQMGVVAIFSIDDFKRYQKPRFGKLLLRLIEANAARLIAKRATIAYYDVF
jgi:hypothetical protein